jgi:two-component system response regulator YesN
MGNYNKETIFIVDDDQGILDSFDAILGDEYTLHMVDNGSDALRFLKNNNPCLLFLDLKMPKPNGLEILKWISEKKIPTKVVVVTALPQLHYEELAQKYGVYNYLRKPFDVNEVEDIASVVQH